MCHGVVQMKKFIMRNMRLIYTVLTILAVIISLAVFNNNFKKVYDAAAEFPNKKYAFTATIVSMPQANEKYTVCEAQVNKIDAPLKPQKIRLSIANNHKYKPVYGDTIEFSSAISAGSLPLNDNGFDYRTYLKSKGISAMCTLDRYISVNKISSVSVMSKAQYCILKMRKAAILALEKSFKGDELGLIKALLTGDRENISDEMRSCYIAAGIYHIVAVSGLHAGILIGFTLLPIAFLKIKTGKRKYISSVLAVLTALFLLIFTGSGVSVYKVLFMSIISCGAVLLTREYNPVRSLVFSAVLISVFMPNSLYNTGFWLSFTSTLGVLITSFVSKRILSGFINPNILDNLSITPSLCSSIVSLPVCVYTFSRISLIAPVANLAVIPLGGITLVSSAIFAPFAHFMPSPVLKVFSFIPYIGAYAINVTAKAASSVSFSYIYVNRLNFFAAFFTIILIFVCTYFILKYYNKRFAVKCIVALFAIFAFISPVVRILNTGVRFDILNMAQGQCTLVKINRGFCTKFIMFDCGSETESDPAENILMPYMSAKGITHIDCLYLTYPDKGHSNGVQKLIQNKLVKQIVMPKEVLKDVKADPYRKVILQTAEKYNVPVLNIKDNNCNIYLKKSSVQTYAPAQNSSFKKNNNSAAYRLAYGNTSFFITGNTGEYEISKLNKLNIKSDIVILPRYGDFTYVTKTFIKNTAKEYVAVSAAKGTDNTVLFLNGNNYKYCSTYENRTLKFISDGKKIMPAKGVFK